MRRKKRLCLVAPTPIMTITGFGGYAEAVFGARFNLPLDFEPGPDGGIDFSIFCSHTPSGILTIDVKGTKYIEFRLAGIERSWEDARGWGYDENFIRRRDHIYVLIVTRSEHAFFKGFAFGTDEFAIRFPRFPGARPGYSPKRLRLMSSWF